MKKIAVVWSSPTKDGLTASAKGQFVKGLELAWADQDSGVYRDAI